MAGSRDPRRMGQISEYVRNYPRLLWQRLPIMFGAVGLLLLGVGRKAARYEAETGNQASMPTFGMAFLAVGIALFAYQAYRRRSASGVDAA